MKNKLFYTITILFAGLFLAGCTQQIQDLTSQVQPENTNPEASVQASMAPGEGEVITALFNCDAGQSITAEFDNTNSQVILTLSDGRVLTLPQAISASGARYANADETEVFWNKGNTAWLEESGVNTFDNCVTNE